MGKKNNYIALVCEDTNRNICLKAFDSSFICNIDLDFMNVRKNQGYFIKLINLFNNHNKNPLVNVFYNSFLIYSKSNALRFEQKEKTISLLLYFVALETLITENKTTKANRLSLLPKLIQIDMPQYNELYGFVEKAKIVNEPSELIRKLYKVRNNFVHAGKLNLPGEENLTFLEECASKTILKILEIDSTWLEPNNKNAFESWSEYLDNILYDNKAKTTKFTSLIVLFFVMFIVLIAMMR